MSVVDQLKDILAYVVHVGSKPIPFIFAAIVVGLFTERLERTSDLVDAVGVTVLVASGLALAVLPPLLRLRSWADKRHRDEVGFWLWAWGASFVFLTLWAFFL